MKNRVNNNLYNIVTPLELLNLYYSDGQSLGNKGSRLWRKMDALLTWDNILNKDYQVNLCPLLYYILAKWKPANPNPYSFNSSIMDVSEDILVQLKNGYDLSLSRNMLLLDELDRVLKAFNEAGIDVIVLKGAALAQTVYPDIALRPMEDVDLLIRQKDSNKAKKLLFSRGYELPLIPRYPKNFMRGYTFQLPELRQKLPGFYLDLHWDFVVKPSVIHIADIWQGAISRTMAGTHIFQMLIEDQLLYLSWHSAKHLFARLIWLGDILHIIGVYRGEINWQPLIEKAEKWGISKFTYYSLHPAKELFGGDVPTHVLAKLKPGNFEISLFNFISNKTGFDRNKIAASKRILLPWIYLQSKDRIKYNI